MSDIGIYSLIELESNHQYVPIEVIPLKPKCYRLCYGVIFACSRITVFAYIECQQLYSDVLTHMSSQLSLSL